MQRIAPNALPPRGGNGSRQGNMGGAGESPAFRMASRIRAEQGPERAAQYLSAMEPFLAPAERAHIADQLGLRLPPPQQHYAQPAAPQAGPPTMPGLGNMGGSGGMPNLGSMAAGLGSMPNLGGIPGMGGGGGAPNMGALGNIGGLMQMMQLFQGMSGGGGGMGGLGGNPMQLAQMLGGLMGGKKN